MMMPCSLAAMTKRPVPASMSPAGWSASSVTMAFPVVKNAPIDRVKKITVAVVVEPASNYVERDGTRYSMMKLFLNGEEVACLGYVPGGGS